MAKRTPARTFDAHTDDAGGTVTYNREDGYLAWLDGVCLGEVSGVDEGILVIAETRMARTESLPVAAILDDLCEAVDAARKAAAGDVRWLNAIDAAWDDLLALDALAFDAVTHALRIGAGAVLRGERVVPVPRVRAWCAVPSPGGGEAGAAGIGAANRGRARRPPRAPGDRRRADAG